MAFLKKSRIAGDLTVEGNIYVGKSISSAAGPYFSHFTTSLDTIKDRYVKFASDKTGRLVSSHLSDGNSNLPNDFIFKIETSATHGGTRPSDSLSPEPKLDNLFKLRFDVNKSSFDDSSKSFTFKLKSKNSNLDNTKDTLSINVKFKDTNVYNSELVHVFEWDSKPTSGKIIQIDGKWFSSEEQPDSNSLRKSGYNPSSYFKEERFYYLDSLG